MSTMINQEDLFPREDLGVDEATGKAKVAVFLEDMSVVELQNGVYVPSDRYIVGDEGDIIEATRQEVFADQAQRTDSLPPILQGTKIDLRRDNFYK